MCDALFSSFVVVFAVRFSQLFRMSSFLFFHTRRGVDTRFALLLPRFPLGVSSPFLVVAVLFYQGFSSAGCARVGRSLVGSVLSGERKQSGFG